MKEQFVIFMENKGLSENTKRHYVLGLTSRIKTFAKKYLPDYVSVFDLKIEDAVSLIKLLEKDVEFLEYYKKSNSNPSSAFHKYLEFIDSLEKPKDDILVGAIVVSDNDEIPTYSKKISVWVDRYESSKKKKKKCIAEKGLCCYVCGMNFENVYGDIGKGFIHVHHIEFLSMNGKDSSENLIPVCPNCHAMLHKQNDKGATIKYEDLKEQVKRCRALKTI